MLLSRKSFSVRAVACRRLPLQGRLLVSGCPKGDLKDENQKLWSRKRRLPVRLPNEQLKRPVEFLDPRVDPPGDGEGARGSWKFMKPWMRTRCEAWECLDFDEVDCKASEHPDNWTEERWFQESHKGKATELGCLRDYGVYKPVPRAQSVGGKYISTRWEEVPKWKEGKWIVRSRFVAQEFKWKDPGRDDIFGVTSSANTGRILDYLLAKKQLRAYLADVECAFFHAPEEGEVYVEPPQEWKDDHPDEDYAIGQTTIWPTTSATSVF